MRIPGWKSARHAGRWARSRLFGGALILGYHRVKEPSNDPFGLCVRPRHFEDQMEVLRAKTRTSTLAEVVDGLGRGVAVRGRIAVTFDDGYIDVAQNAVPVLQRNGIPATVFVVSGSIGQRLWWDELASLVLDSPDVSRADTALAKIGVNHLPPLKGDHSVGARQKRLAAMHQALLDVGIQKRQEFLGELNATREAAPTASGQDEIMAGDDLARLARSGLITVGSHSVSHAALAALPEHQQLFELRESRRQLESVTGRLVQDVSYPHGSVTAATRRLAKESGYRSGCASTQDVTSRASDPFCLPRFWIPDWDGDRFARWLHRWQT